jgi:hypothetical protein
MIFFNPLWTTYCLVFSTIATVLVPVVGSSMLDNPDGSRLAKRLAGDPYCANSPVRVKKFVENKNRNGVVFGVSSGVVTLLSDVCLCVQGGQFTATSQSDLQRLYTTEPLAASISNLAAGALTAEERTVAAVQKNITDCTLGTTCMEGIVSFPCDCLNDSQKLISLLS